MKEEQIILSVMSEILLAVTDKKHIEWLDNQTPETLMEYVRKKLADCCEIYTIPIGSNYISLVDKKMYNSYIENSLKEQND